MDDVQELAELRCAIDRAIQRTNYEILNISSNLLLTSLASLVLGVGIGFFLNILRFWVPACFLLWLLWLLYSLINSIVKSKSASVESKIETIGKYKDMKEGKRQFASTVLISQMSPILYAVACIYFVTIVILLLMKTNAIEELQSVSFSVISIVAAALLFIGVFFIRSRTTGLSEINKFSEVNWIRPRNALKGLLAFSVMLTIVLVLPILALCETTDLWMSSSDAPFLVVVLLFQVVILFMFAGYSSSINAKVELTNTITILSALAHRIDYSLITQEQSVTPAIVSDFKKEFSNSKRFNVYVGHMFGIIPIYVMKPNNVYLNTME